MFGFAIEVLAPYLPTEQFREFAKEDADLSDWKARTLDVPTVLAEMKDYMEFAWGKVEDHRGISASRSVEKMTAWLWLMGDEDVIQGVGYTNYGAPILMAICQKYGFPSPDNEGVRNMAQGKKCYDGCDGCGV